MVDFKKALVEFRKKQMAIKPKTKVIAFDTETYLMGAGAVAPKLVCASFCFEDGSKGLLGNGDKKLVPMLRAILSDPEATVIAHYMAFDFTVVHESYPQLRDLLWEAAEAGRLQCTKIREKLLNISTHGGADRVPGTNMDLRYHLKDLAKEYLGKDRSEEKNSEDSWRLHFSLLDGEKAQDYPKEAYEYALDDASDLLDIFKAQAERVETEHGPASLSTAKFHTAVDCALRMMTVRGLAIDQEAVEKVRASVESEINEKSLEPLYKGGLLNRPSPPQPYANGAKNKDGTPKMKAAVEASKNMQQIRDLVEIVAHSKGIELKRTPKGEISTDSETLETLSEHNELLALLHKRERYQKLLTSYLPSLTGTESIHPDYDVLKETGRTSSKGSRLYPSDNIQQVDPRVRCCYKSRPGKVLCSIDYSGIELVSAAQTCYTLFGESSLRDVINSGKDPHAYLGAQLALDFHPEFRELCEQHDIQNDKDAVYEAFIKCKKSGEQEVRDFYNLYRTFAKPTGLGYWGGLGPATFCNYAKATYGLIVSMEDATAFREVWRRTFPEVVQYFRYIDTQKDPNNLDSYAYTTPFGMYRAGAGFCAAANGKALQSPTSEGAKLAVFKTSWHCYHSKGDLQGSYPVAFIHDEIIFELEDDPDIRHTHAFRAAEIMIECMKEVAPDVEVKAEPALMYVWNKKAEKVLDSNGLLIPWDLESQFARVRF